MPTPSPRRVASLVILISGRGSNMQAIVEQAQRGALSAEVRAVVSDRSTAPGLELARGLGVETQALSPKQFADRPAYDAALADVVARYSPDLVVLAGFMRVLSPEFVRRFAGRLLNIHPSLLPKYPGLHTHRRALEAGDREHGVSVHFVTEELDGGPVIVQARVPVVAGDDEATLSARVQREEHRIYSEAIQWFADGRLGLRDGAVWLDGRPLAAPIISPA